MQSRERANNNDRRRVWIYIVASGAKDVRIRQSTQKKRSGMTALSEINSQFGKSGTAVQVGLHDLRTTCEKRDIDILQGFRRNDLSNLDITRKFLQQACVLLGFEKDEFTQRKAAILDKLL